MWIDTIKAKIARRKPELGNDSDLMEDLIDESLYDIVSYANADKYNTAWDRVLIQCVLQKYNTMGIEGSISRSASGVSDRYESSDVCASIISRNVPQYLKPSGYIYKSTRFDRPL